MSRRHPTFRPFGPHLDARGSVLIIVIWVCLGLVALTLYSANSASSELRAADNRGAEVEAQQAVSAGTRYAAYLLSQFAVGGVVPRIEDYRCEAMPVGEATFWFIGRDPNHALLDEPVFGLVDESSKLNLNRVDRTVLEGLPGITPEVVEAIWEWRRRANEAGGSALGSAYSSLQPARLNKGAAYESVDELRLVYGVTLDVLFGEDTNRNGALDPNENDGEQSAPRDDQNGQLLAGIAEYVTVRSQVPTRSPSGSLRINISNLTQVRDALTSRLNARLGPGRGTQIIGLIQEPVSSVAEFMVRSGMTAEEFARVHQDITHVAGGSAGLVNVNTASEVVLACIPGIGPEHAATMVAYRIAHPDALTTMMWLRDVLPTGAIRTAGPHITDHSYRFSADVAAVGRNGRGYARARTIFDMSNGTPRIIYHQDLTPYGWALGASVRQWTRTAKESGI